MLFNVSDGPFEQLDAAVEHPNVCREALYLLDDWHDEAMMTMRYRW